MTKQLELYMAELKDEVKAGHISNEAMLIRALGLLDYLIRHIEANCEHCAHRRDDG